MEPKNHIKLIYGFSPKESIRYKDVIKVCYDCVMTFLAIRWFRYSILSNHDKNIIKMIARLIWNDCEDYLPMHQYYYLPRNYFDLQDPYIGFDFGHIECNQDLSLNGELKLNIFSTPNSLVPEAVEIPQAPSLHIINLYKKHFPHLDAKTFAIIYDKYNTCYANITVVCGFYLRIETLGHFNGDIFKSQHCRYDYNSGIRVFYGINLSPTWQFDGHTNTEFLANILCNTYRVPRKWRSETKFKEMLQKDLINCCGYTKRESDLILKSQKPIITFIRT